MKSGKAFFGVAELEEVGNRFGVDRVEKKFAGMNIDNAVTPQERALTRFFRVHVDEGNIEDAIAAYEALPMVTSAYRIALHLMDATPNDAEYSSQWHYYTTYGVDADDAWDLETGDATVVVGILDSGVKYDHGDLGGSNPPGPADNSSNGNIWINDQEIPGNGVDDDGNGFVDDVIGYDFLVSSFRCRDIDCGTADNDPMDGLGHGTHVSGTVSAINNNGYRVSGVAGGWNDGTTGGTANGAKILCCRIGYKTSNSGVVDMGAAADAMVYTGQLKARGVNVAAINCSWGSSESADLAAAVDYLVSQDVLIVVAAGNSNSITPRYLNSRTDCMSVGGTDVNGNPYTASNYGPWVDVAAPAVNVISTVSGTGDLTQSYNGTSMAAPHVCGVAALLESYEPTLSMQDKWDIMCDPANVKAYNPTKDVGEGIVSAILSLNAVGSSCTDPPVADFSGTPTSGDYPLTVNFSDLSTNNPTSWEWDFGDGSPHVYTQNPSHQYTAAGDYTVTLTATNACGSDGESKPNYIHVSVPSNPPVAAFTANPTSGIVPLEVTFTDQSTNGPTSWEWNFGDGSPVSYDQNPVHTYTAIGDYDVTLTVTNTFGSDSHTEYDYISVSDDPGYSMYVYDIEVWRQNFGRNCIIYCKVTVYDQADQALEGADVSVELTGPANASGTAATGADGSVTFQYGPTRTCSGDYCFEVTDVVKAGYAYDPADNNETKVCESGVVFKDAPMDSQSLMPNEFGLAQNYPNPFNPTTEISFSMKEPGHASLVVYNIRGQKVATLADGIYSTGHHTVTWDATKMASGIYLYRLEAGEFTDIKKMLLIK
jgi:PKD repeat protein